MINFKLYSTSTSLLFCVSIAEFKFGSNGSSDSFKSKDNVGQGQLMVKGSSIPGSYIKLGKVT